MCVYFTMQGLQELFRETQYKGLKTDDNFVPQISKQNIETSITGD